MRYLILAMLLLLSSGVFAQEADTFDEAFEESEEQAKEKKQLAGDARGLIWGLSQDDVKQFEEQDENTKFYGPYANTLNYKGPDFGIPAQITYTFYDNGLGRVTVEYRSTRSNPQDHLNDYIMIKEKITGMYGLPTVDDINWINERYMNDTERWGLGMMLGTVEFYATWSTPTTIIRLTLKGGDMKAKLQAVYLSKTVLASESEGTVLPDRMWKR